MAMASASITSDADSMTAPGRSCNHPSNVSRKILQLLSRVIVRHVHLRETYVIKYVFTLLQCIIHRDTVAVGNWHNKFRILALTRKRRMSYLFPEHNKRDTSSAPLLHSPQQMQSHNEWFSLSMPHVTVSILSIHISHAQAHYAARRWKRWMR